MDTLSADRRIRRKPEQAARRAGSSKEQNALRSEGFIANNFIKYRFLPVYEQAEIIPHKKEVEKGFFKSLSILAEAHHFSLLDVSDRPYPYNILLAHWDASQQLKV